MMGISKADASFFFILSIVFSTYGFASNLKFSANLLRRHVPYGYMLR